MTTVSKVSVDANIVIFIFISVDLNRYSFYKFIGEAILLELISEYFYS